MNGWVSGKPISEMIANSISFHEDNDVKLYLDYGNDRPIYDGSQAHINHLIDDLLKNIEKVLRFTFERYFNHYHKVLTNFLGEDDSGQNWAAFLEYGSKHPLVIAMQNLGLSRYTAQKIFKDSELKKCLVIESKTNQLIGFNKQKLIKKLDVNSIEYDEISMFA